MPTRKLTARAVETLRTERSQEDFRDEVVPGLVLRIGRGGTKTYTVRYRLGGRYRRVTLGTHPQLTLADARERARNVIAAAQASRARIGDPTFRALFEFVATTRAGKHSAAHARNRRWLIERHVMPHWESRSVASIGRHDVTHLLENMTRAGAAAGANRVLEQVRAIFNEGLRAGFPTLEMNPAHLIPRPVTESPRTRFLSAEEIGRVWQAAGSEGPLTRGMVRLIILTGQRVANVRAMKWGDTDFADVWRVPAERSAGSVERWVPLSTAAKAVLRELRAVSGEHEYVFPARVGSRHGHLNGSGSQLLNRLRQRAALAEPWTLHDMRRTFRIHATLPTRTGNRSDPRGLGAAPGVVDAVLGRVQPFVDTSPGAGDPRIHLLAEKRAALEAWGVFVLAAARSK